MKPAATITQVWPDEVVYKMLFTRPGNTTEQWAFLSSMCLTCKQFRAIVYDNRDDIVAAYSTIVERTGITTYLFCDMIHRDGGLPAKIYPSGCKAWYRYGKLHREGLPAVCNPSSGHEEWWLRGAPHRAGGLPAVTHSDGSREWYQNGKLHRDGDQPAVIGEGGLVQEWWQNGSLHRENNMPAKVYASGRKEWWLYGRLHREGGAAIINTDGSHSWYRNGVHLGSTTSDEAAGRV